MPNVRASAAIAFFLIGLTAILGAQRYIQTSQVDKPMRQAVSAVQGVSEYRVDERGGHTEVTVTLDKVEDLPTTYASIRTAIVDGLGSSDASLTILDRRSSALGAVWFRMHYFIEEAATLGNFAEMKDRVDESLEDTNVKPTVWVGEDSIFVALRDSGRSLYEVIPRRDARPDQDAQQL